MKHFHVLHECVLLLTINTSLLPRIPVAERLHFEELAPGLARAVLSVGFMDQPRVPATLAGLPEAWQAVPMGTTFVLDRQILVPSGKPGMARWREALFGGDAAAGSATEYYDLPPSQGVELGAQATI